MNKIYAKIIEYEIITDRTITGLASKVRSKIKSGYEPEGE
jgi:hypothetical protein